MLEDVTDCLRMDRPTLHQCSMCVLIVRADEMGLTDNRNSFNALNKQGYSKKVLGWNLAGAPGTRLCGICPGTFLCGFSPGILASSHSAFVDR